MTNIFLGYIPKYNQRTEKSGGTIKIQGMCPSQLICRLYHSGTISVSFWKTHAGHGNELRSLHLSTSEKDIIVEKLKSGVPVDRILEDARKTGAPELQRINLINRNDITYITRKHNINKIRDPNAAKTLGETSIIKPQKQEEITQFLQEKYSQQISEELMDQNSLQVRRTQFRNWTDSLNNDIFNRFMDHIQGAIRKADKAQHKIANKCKMETQAYFPTNKRRKVNLFKILHLVILFYFFISRSK